MKILIYCRETYGCSLDEQERALRTYCNNRGYEVVDVFKETCSRCDSDRSQMRRLYNYCKKHMDSIDKILFIRWNILSRSMELVFQYKEKFEEIGIEINAIESPVDFTSSYWPTLLALICGLTHFEDVKRSKRIRMGMHHAVLKRNDKLSVVNDL